MKTNIVILSICAALPGLALNQESWVKSTGSGSACTFVAPCATFQAALGATSPGGIVRAIDTADYGPMFITQAVTIDGNGTGASIAAAVNTIAIYVQIGVSGAVVIRNLVLTGGGTLNGIQLYSSAVIENVSISGTWTGAGIVCAANGNSAGVTCSLRNVSITGLGEGVTVAGASASVRDSLLQGNQIGIFVTANTAGIPGTAIIERSQISFNGSYGIAVDGSSGPAHLWYSDCVVTGNSTGLNPINGGQIITFRTNMLTGNTADGATPFSISLK